MPNESKKGARRYDVDWLRVIAVCILILIHTAAMFTPDPFTSIKGQRIRALEVFSTFVHQWRLAILFLVSGAGSYFALGFLNGSRFVSVRLRRIVIPLVMGTLLLVPVHHYFGLLFQNPGYQKTYPQFYAKVLGDFVRAGSFGRGQESLHWAHLWFLAYLFAASMVALPLFLYLRRDEGRRLIGRLAAFATRRWMIFLFALPLVLAEVILRARPSQTRLLLIDDPAGFLFYTILFVYGFVIVADEKISDAIERHRKSALLFGVLASAAFLIITFAGLVTARGYNLRWTLFMALRAFNTWLWCVAILGFGSRHLKFKHKALPYLNEAVYPVYVLHLPVATAVGYYLVRLNIWPAAQLALIALCTLAFSLCLYEFVIRRTGVTRFLFGLKPQRPGTSAHAPSASQPDALIKPKTPEEASPSRL